MGEDVILIAKHMVQNFNRELGREVEGFTDEAREKLLDHMWPGNVRELRNVLERAMIFADDAHITADDLTLAPPGNLGDTQASGAAFQFPMGRTLKEVEQAYIRRTLEKNEDKSYADIADSLGISKKTLWDKRKRYDLDELVER
jgi:DNA-binding NtrC family response regulator